MLNVNKRRNNGQLSEKERKLKIVFVRKKSRKIETPAMEIASSQIKENKIDNGIEYKMVDDAENKMEGEKESKDIIKSLGKPKLRQLKYIYETFSCHF